MFENQNQRRRFDSQATTGRAQSFDMKLPEPSQQPAFPALGTTLGNYRNEQQILPTAGPRPRQTFKAPTQPKAAQAASWRRLFTKKHFKRAALVLLAIILISGVWVGWKFIYNAHKLFGGSIFSAFTTTKLKGESSGRVNILLAGNSADDPGHDGANLTDSIMILSIDTKNNTAFMLSVPRDLYVKLPYGVGYQKINDAYPTGEANNFSASGYPNGGMGLLEQIIQQKFGITCDYYALVDYAALRDAVNDVGGITVNIASSDPRGLYDPSIDYTTGKGLVKLSNGQHVLDGEQALDLARARGDSPRSYGFAQSDFTRTANQRALILALRQKATSAGVLANPIKLGELFDAVGAHTKTDLHLSEVHRLYDITKNINGNSIQSIGLNNADGKNLLTNYQSYNAGDSLIPAAGIDDYSDIQAFIQKLISSNPLVREGASVVVLNGTSVSGLAAKAQYALDKQGLNVSAVGDAKTSTQAVTQIIDLTNGKMPATLAALKKDYPGSTSTTTNPYGTAYDTNFIIVLGADHVPTTHTSSSTTNQ